METPPAFPHEVWERTPSEAQAHIRALEVRVEALEAMVRALQEHNRTLQEQLNQTSRNSSRPPSSDPPQPANLHVPAVLGVSAVAVVNRGTLAIRAPCFLWKKLRRW